MQQLLQTTVFGLLHGGVYALMASGLTLVFGVMHIINVAHGAMLILSAFLTFALWQATGFDPVLSAPLMAVGLGALGWAVYKLLLVRLRGTPVSMSVLLTFGLALTLEGVMGVVWGGNLRSATPSYFTESVSAGGLTFPVALLYGAAGAVVVLTLLYVLLRTTWTGRAIRASAENPDSSRLIGVRVTSVAALAFAVGAATAGAAGSILSVLYPFLPGSHYVWISRLLGIIVLGGMGSLPGAAVGALLLGVAESLVAVYVSSGWAVAVFYISIIVVLLARPQGLLGSPTRADVAA